MKKNPTRRCVAVSVDAARQLNIAAQLSDETAQSLATRIILDGSAEIIRKQTTVKNLRPHASPAEAEPLQRLTGFIIPNHPASV
jgi:hypothetical protein